LNKDGLKVIFGKIGLVSNNEKLHASMTNDSITKHLKLPLTFDADSLQKDLNKVLGVKWIDHFNVDCYEGKWNSIPLYSLGGAKNNIIALPSTYSEPVEATEFMQDCDYFRSVLAQFKCPLISVRLLNLGPGAYIKPHNDYNLGYEDGCFRLHIPILTNPQVKFILDDILLPMLPGECWYTNVNYIHSVSNEGDNDRIHLVIDGERNDWSDSLFFELALKESLVPNKFQTYDLETTQLIIQELEINKPDGYENFIQELRTALNQN
jgi:hypothetical protein